MNFDPNLHPKLIYAGIGSRETPHEICLKMMSIAQQLGPTGWFLRSGHAVGADLAFEMGAPRMEVHLPWNGYNGEYRGRVKGHADYVIPKPSNEIMEIAARHHPAWERLKDSVKLLMCRNVTIILGTQLDQHAKMVICWTPNGELVGGTAHGMRIASTYGIPVFNLAKAEDQNALCKFVLER